MRSVSSCQRAIKDKMINNAKLRVIVFEENEPKITSYIVNCRVLLLMYRQIKVYSFKRQTAASHLLGLSGCQSSWGLLSHNSTRDVELIPYPSKMQSSFEQKRTLACRFFSQTPAW